MKNHKTLTINIPIFDFELTVTRDDKIASDFLKSINEEFPSYMAFFCFNGTDAKCLIYLSKNIENCYLYAAFAHEASHVVTRILKTIHSDCDELRSYIIAYIFEKYDKFLIGAMKNESN